MAFWKSFMAPPVPALCLLGMVLFLALPSAHAENLPEFEVVAREGRLLPPLLAVPAMRRVKLALKNAGATPVEFENLELRVEKVLAPGAASFTILPSLKPGTYTFVDEFHPENGRMQIIAH